MKKTLLLLFFIGLSSLQAQALQWNVDVNDAIALSNKNRKPMMILFTANNMDMALQNEVFKTYDFNEWYKNKVILVRLDLSDKNLSENLREANIKLKNAFDVNDIPMVCFAKASVRNERTTFQFIGKLKYDNKGLRSWLDKADEVFNHSEE